MKNILKRIFALLLVAALLTACGSTAAPEAVPEVSPVTVDAQGIASWAPVEGAVEYEYCIVDDAFTNLGAERTTGTSVQLPEGRCIHVRAVFADGTFGDWLVSDFFGEPGLWSSGEAAADPGTDPGSDDPRASGEIHISLDEKGYARWDAVDGATAYHCEFINSLDDCTDSAETRDTFIRVPLDHCVRVFPILADGTYANCSIISGYNGTGRSPYADMLAELIDHRFSLRLEDTHTYDILAGLVPDSVRTDSDGTLHFDSVGPKGETLRFVGTGVTLGDDGLTFAPGGEVLCLDAIGRICGYMPLITAPGHEENVLDFSGGYTFDERTSVDSADELFKVWPIGIHTRVAADALFSMMEQQPNMIGFGATDTNEDSFTLAEMTVFYDEATYATPIGSMVLNYQFYGSYLEGQFYDASREVYDSENGIYTFYLLVMPQLLDEILPDTTSYMEDMAPYVSRAVMDIPMERYSIGQLKDARGNGLDKATDPLAPGCTVEISIAGATYDLELPVLERFKGAQTLHELTPYNDLFSLGEMTALVIPVRWSNYQLPDPDGQLALIRQKLGRVVDESGAVTDYSPDPAEGWSLSSYYSTSSYGALQLESFLTGWVTAPCTLEEMACTDILSSPLAEELVESVRQMYPHMDWTRFDRNADGILDCVIFLSSVEAEGAYPMISFGGGVHVSTGYSGERAGTPEDPNLKNFIAIGSGMLDASPNVLIHEFGHAFGLIDYYDVTYSGIDAVGRFDMQSGSYGDWNPYSKYAAGWIAPQVVTDLEPGSSIELTIGAFSETGDAIVIPAAGKDHDGPFGEYILLDLFTATGVNLPDATAFGLGGATGVRIYHINANMERRDLTDRYGDPYTVGTTNIANDDTKDGRFQVELLQRGGNNTFTDLKDLRTDLKPQDLFRAGDRFDAAGYGEFLQDGRMDDGSEFGYIIEILRIDGTGADATATVRITGK